MTTVLSQCIFCKHYRDDETCTAFPAGIPRKVMYSERDHRKPYPGDNGVRFEPVDREAAEIVDQMFAKEQP